MAIKKVKQKVMYKLQIFKGRSGWYSRIRHSNGQILWTSESYTRKAKASQTAIRFLTSISQKCKIEYKEL